MAKKLFLRGDFLEIYPYMDWLFLVNHDGDLLVSRTENLVQDPILHDLFFRQNKQISNQWDEIEIEISLEKFKKIAKVADKFSFSDLRFFYSNVLCASNNGLEFLSFDTKTEQITKKSKITDAPISSLAARYMTVFASSLEDTVTTMFGVKAGEYSHLEKTGVEASRVGVSSKQIHFYLGATNLSISKYEKKVLDNDEISEEDDREMIGEIEDARPYKFGQDSPDFVFNSNEGIYMKFGNEIRYRREGKKPFTFELGKNGKLVRAHLYRGGVTYEFLDGLFLHSGEKWSTLLKGECISTRGYANSVNYQKSITATNDEGAYYFLV